MSIVQNATTCEEYLGSTVWDTKKMNVALGIFWNNSCKSQNISRRSVSDLFEVKENIATSKD